MAVLLIGFYVYFIRESPPVDAIFENVSDVREISFEKSGQVPKGIYGYVTGTSRACMGFDTLHSRKDTVRYIGAGAVLRMPPDPNPDTRYIVKEVISKNDVSSFATWPSEWPWMTTINIFDKEKNKIIATKVMWQNEREMVLSYDGIGGWQGEKAALFIYKALNPPIKLVSSTCIARYPKTKYTYEKNTTEEFITYSSLYKVFSNCPSAYEKTRWGDLKIDNQIYDFSMGIKKVICTESGVYVISWIYPEQMNIDWLDNKGNLVSQFTTRLPLPLLRDGFRFSELKGLINNDKKLIVTRLYSKNRPTRENNVEADIEIVYSIDVDNSQKLFDDFKHTRRSFSPRRMR